MNMKEFAFPGAILGLVLVIAVGLLLTQGRETTPPLKTNSIATSSISASTTTKPASAGTPAAPTHYYPYGKTTLAINQVAGFKNGLSIRPVSVIEDSRCPIDVQCIQAGTVRISLKTTYAGNSSTHTLALGEHVTVGGVTVTFDSAAPQKKANTPINSYSLTFTVIPGTSASGQCYVGGCSQEICSDVKGQVSSCIYSPVYACYKTAKCERQKSGQCGWTKTPELTSCLTNVPM